MYSLAPDPREQESLYSVLARLARYLHVNEAGPFMRLMLGRRLAIASHDLPGGLAAFVRDIPLESRDSAIDQIIDQLTLFPFHTAFMPAGIRVAVRAMMRDDVTGVYTRLGLAAFKVRPPDRLRFCLTCLDNMEAAHGDAWWRRDHQLPGVPLCASHGSVLRLSDVILGDVNRHSFVAATRLVCRADAAPEITGFPSDAQQKLLDLSRRAASLLVEPPSPLEFAERAEDYRSRLAQVGLMRSRRKVDHRRLAEAFYDRWGNLPDLIPGLALADDAERSWLAAMVRTGRRAAHPLQHVMLTAMLEDLSTVPARQPFGVGPWTCRNPVAEHFGQPAIEQIEVRRSRGVEYGDFACKCGYLYTRPCGADGTIGEPKFRRFGPLFIPALRSAVRQKLGLRATARLLGLDPKTVLREAAMAGVDVHWKTAPSGSILIKAPARKQAIQPRHRQRAKAKRNWAAIDNRLARTADDAAVVILAQRPPVRVTGAALERRVARHDWIAKRRAKLPQTVVTLATAAETTTAFRERRLSWHVTLAIAAGDLRAGALLRKAGLPSSWLPRVVAALDNARLHGRDIA